MWEIISKIRNGTFMVMGFCALIVGTTVMGAVIFNSDNGWFIRIVLAALLAWAFIIGYKGTNIIK